MSPAVTSTAPAADSLPTTPFARIGEHPVLQAIADRFYDLMDQDPAYAELRAIHAPDLGAMRSALPQFLAGWAGGPRDWFEANPGKCMMSMHAPFPISRQTATQWAEAMEQAIADCEVADREIADAMAEVLSRMAKGMARD